MAAEHKQLTNVGKPYWAVFALFLILVFLGGLAAFAMEHEGHVITGMDNQVVWGLPHVFAVFLIVSASGALNVASIGTVFGRTDYKPFAPLSGILAISLLVGGLSVLVLDLGRPDRLIVAMTHYNFKSIFAWNVMLYSGFVAVVAGYLYTLMYRPVEQYSKKVGLFAFVWRLTLTTGTGSIFGFLIGREAFGTAFLGPLFVVYSLAYGMAVFLLLLNGSSYLQGERLNSEIQRRFSRLFLYFILLIAYSLAVFHATNLYFSKQHAAQEFVLWSGEPVSWWFWIAQVGLGLCLPAGLLLRRPNSRAVINVSALLVVFGGLSQMYVTIVGSQLLPQELFPGYVVSSSFYDGMIHKYSPSMYEWLLGFGGVGVAGSLLWLALRVLPFLPKFEASGPSSAVTDDAMAPVQPT